MGREVREMGPFMSQFGTLEFAMLIRHPGRDVRLVVVNARPLSRPCPSLSSIMY